VRIYSFLLNAVSKKRIKRTKYKKKAIIYLHRSTHNITHLHTHKPSAGPMGGEKKIAGQVDV
jgi:methylglyoxal synthase